MPATPKMSEIVDRIKQEIVPGIVIPRPKSAGLVVRNWSNTGECGGVYCASSYKKKVTESELKKAYDQLMATGKLTRIWFKVSIVSATPMMRSGRWYTREPELVLMLCLHRHPHPVEEPGLSIR